MKAVAAMLLLAPGVAAQPARPRSFLAGELIQAAGSTTHLLAADVDGDGRADVVAVHGERSEVGVHLSRDDVRARLADGRPSVVRLKIPHEELQTVVHDGVHGSVSFPNRQLDDHILLKSNGFPSGKTELTPDSIANVQIIPKDGPGELPGNTLVRIVGCLAPKSGSDWTLTNATVPQRIEKTGAVPEDTTRPLGDRTMTLKFVLNRLDSFVGQRMAVTGILIGAGGVNGINVATVNRVAEACP